MDRSRQEILAENGLAASPKGCRQLFWLRYNRQYRWKAVRLGDVADGLLSDAALRSARRLGGLSEAWGRVVPAEYASLTKVESFRNGRLVISVDSAATRYALGRQAGAGLIERLNQEVGGDGGWRVCRVQEIQYRVGAASVI